MRDWKDIRDNAEIVRGGARSIAIGEQPILHRVTLAAEDVLQLLEDLRDIGYCWDRGPRIGSDGVAYCFRVKGHIRGRHKAHESFQGVEW